MVFIHLFDYVIIALVAALFIFAAVTYIRRDKTKDNCLKCRYKTACPTFREREK